MSKGKPPRFKVGQVVSVWSFYGKFAAGEVGPGFQGKRGWRHGCVFAKIVKVNPRDDRIQLPHAPHCYVLDGWISAQTEDHLRPLTKREKSA